MRLYHKLSQSNVLLAAVSGAALFLSFPRPALYPLAWIALVPLFLALRRARPVGSLFLGLAAGFVFFASVLYWIAIFGYLPWVLLALAQALFIAVFAVLANLIYNRGRFALLAIPALWTAMEWLRSLGTFGFTWGGLAYSQARWPGIIQIATITGPWGVSFLIVLVNAAIAEALGAARAGRRLYLAAVALLVFVAAFGGWLSIVHGRSLVPDKKIALIQGGLPMTWRDPGVLERIYQTYWPMTDGLRGRLDFVVWPESALPDDLLSSDYLRREMARFARKSGAYILAGGPHVVTDQKAEGGYREYNGAFLISPSGEIVGQYFKVHLVPFGEFVPGRKWLPFLERYRVRDVDYSRGRGYHTLHSLDGDLGVMICFESIFPQIGRRLARDGADILFVITNDSWFLETAAAAQHHDFSVLRAVENRRYVARNATTGITSIITPWGEVTGSAGLGQRAVVQGRVAMIRSRTFYTKYGDWFAVLCVVVALASLVAAILRQYKPAGRPR